MVCIDSACYDLIICDPNAQIDWSAVTVFGGVGLELIGWDEACDGGRVFHFSYFSKCAVGPLPFCAPSFNIIPNEDGSYYFENTSAHNGLASYYWDFGDNTSSLETNPTHVFLEAGGYNVCLTITTSFGCTNVECLNLNVVNISELEDDWRVYPNPASGLLQIETFLEFNSGQISVFTADGREVIRENYTGRRISLECNGLETGTYLLVLSSDRGSWRRLIQIH
jgi:hypothetical protein